MLLYRLEYIVTWNGREITNVKWFQEKQNAEIHATWVVSKGGKVISLRTFKEVI